LRGSSPPTTDALRGQTSQEIAAERMKLTLASPTVRTRSANSLDRPTHEGVDE
jgi:hypothetical protein